MSTIQQKLQDLIGGYIKEVWTIERNDKWPVELNKIVMHFLGNVLIKFDVVGDAKLLEYIRENGKFIETDMYKDHTMNFGSSCCMKDGVTIIDVKCVQLSSTYNTIGVLSNIGEFKKGEWLPNITGYMYIWDNNEAIYGEKDGADIEPWKEGDIITLKIDLNAWEITFYLNQKAKHKMKLEQHIDYYFVMEAYEHCAYRIL